MSLYQNGFPTGYNASSLYNPQQTPYTNAPRQNNAAAQLSPKSEAKSYITWAEGEVGAKAVMLAPNTILPVWDSENPVIYIKATDEYGRPYPTTILDYTVRKVENPSPLNIPADQPKDTGNYISKEEFNNYMTNFLQEVRRIVSDGAPAVQQSSGNSTEATANQHVQSVQPAASVVPERTNAIYGGTGYSNPTHVSK